MNMKFLDTFDDYIKMKRYPLVNSVVVYENDELVFERYYNKFNENTANTIMSVWKSILSIMLGICMDKNMVKSIDEPIYHYLSPFAQNIDPFHRLITIRHLLTMSSGIFYNPGPNYSGPMLEQLNRSKDPVSHIANVQIKHAPGTYFTYKEWDTILLSAVISKVCGGTISDIIKEYLYTPLEINEAQWKTVKCGICKVQCTCNVMTALNMAKIGVLMSNGGKWNGQRIVSEEYTKIAVLPSGIHNGYGFLWWLSKKGYHGRGFGGQELNIYPIKRIVTVVQATPTPRNKNYSEISENIVR